MTLIIAEKPSLARSIADAIPGIASGGVAGSYIKGEYTITNVFGHLMELKAPQDYDPELKIWSLNTLPIYFKNWEKKPIEREPVPGRELPADRLNAIGGLLKHADMVIHAGDPDDEGQCLIDEVLEYFQYKGPVKRLATGDTSMAALKKALQAMDDNRNHILSGRAAYARSVADLMVGINLSRFFTLKNPGVLLTIGRVQTPTLGLVVARDALRENHKTVYYYTPKVTLNVNGNEFEVSFIPNKDAPYLTDGRILDLSVAQRVATQLKAKEKYNGVVTTKQIKEQPPLPFNQTKLQVYCEKHWGYSPEQTLKITQSLRDNYNAISYNRSDCQYLTSNQHAEAPNVMAYVIKNINYKLQEMDLSIRSRAFDDAYVTGSGSVAHLAIIPQAVSVDLSKLSVAERNVYLAICQYYMIQFMPPAVKQKTKFVADAIDGGNVEATSTQIIEEGYRSVFSGDVADEELSSLSQLTAGDYKAQSVSSRAVEGKTSPPPAYTQASLAEDMSRIAKYVDEPEIKELLLSKDKNNRNENGSIGTEATRAGIITELLHRGYLETGNKNTIHATALGKELCRILPQELTKPNLTARWWSIQEDIKAGNATPETLEQSVLAMIEHTLQTEYPTVNMSIIPDSLKRNEVRAPVGQCPRCGAPVIEGKLGYGCSAYKSGCKFVIWKNPKSPMLQNVTFTCSDASALLSGKSIQKKNLCAKSGKTFSGTLILDDDPEAGYTNIKLVIEDKKSEEVGICPRCGKAVLEGFASFRCSGHTDGCNFAIWKTSKMHMLSKTQITTSDAKLLLQGKTIVKKNLLKKDGGKFTGTLAMVDDGANQYGATLALVPKGGVTSK